MDRLKAYSIERINGRFKKNKHLEWSDTSCLFSEIDRLRKEKEWLIGNMCFNYLDPEITIEEAKKDIIKLMQQALKEE